MQAIRNDRRPILRKAASALLVFLLLYFLLSVCFTTAFIGLAFGRRDLVPSTELRYEETKICEREDISFDSGGRTLRGWLYPASASCRGLIVVVHGVGGGADSHLGVIERFLSAGYSVLAYDGTGTRRSEGWGIRGLGQASLDLEAALRYVQSDARLCALPLFLYGHSAGAYAVARVLPEHPEVMGAVCLAAFDRPLEEMLYHARQKAGFLVEAETPFLRAALYLLFGETGTGSASEALSACDTPVLVVAGAEDTVVPLPVSLFARRGEITNHAAEYRLLSGGHDDLWLSQEARRCRAEALQGTVQDARRCCEPDEELMADVLRFFAAAEQYGREAA